MKTITIAENIFEQDTWQTLESDNVCQSLIDYFKVWPENARIYNGKVALINDITPISENDVNRINQYAGPFFVIVSPAGAETLLVLAIIAIVAVVAFLPKPSIPTVATRNNQSASPNNELSNRANKARPNSRIPDIFGSVRSTPDLLAVPYSVFVNHQERIYDYMCIGRGSYKLADFRDGQTRINQIKGSSVEVYGPFHSPNDGVIQESIGSPINEKVLSAARSKSVNGQVLLAENDIGGSELKSFTNSIGFVFPNKVVAIAGNNIDFTDNFFDTTKKLIIRTSNHRNCDDCYMFNFSGVYTITSVTPTEITLTNPNLISDSWNQIQIEAPYNNTGGSYGIAGHVVSLGLGESSTNWIGPFTIDQPTITKLICNFVAVQGMYKDNGTEQTTTNVEIEVGITPLKVNGLANSQESFYTITIEGSSKERGTRAATLKVDFLFVGRISVRARRITPKDILFEGQVADEVKWRDLYGVSPVSQSNFGDVTTVQSVTFATPNALSLSERELNVLATRKLPQRILGNIFSDILMPTNNAADIFCAVCLDSKIGARNIEELDVSDIYAKVDAVASYFGTTKAAEFCYTFDSENISFEETGFAIADAVFCQAFRRGNVIKLTFEKETTDSMLLFSHRNKVPKSESRTITFGNQNNNDGVEYQYISPDDDAVITKYVPENQSAINPKKVESIGVRNHRQAHFHARRMFNKIRFQTLLVEFEALQEAELVQRNDRVLIADNASQKFNDGEIIAQDGLTLTLSQKHLMQSGTNYSIYLQHVDGTVEFLSITADEDDYSVLLDGVPRLPLSLDEEASVRAVYMIVPDIEANSQACLIAERAPNDNFTSNVKAINYTAKYYQNDKDYINAVIS